jgi:AbiV family abortive infection protein
MSALSVTPQFLLQGAVYALEQCGRLLRDAVQLHNSGSHASAVVLAAFAREELGREKLLIELRQNSLSGGTFAVSEIKKACKDHVTKQRAGMLSTALTATSPDFLAELIQTRMRVDPQSKEWKEANAKLEELDQIKQKRDPRTRHEQRESALYVEPITHDRWNRPAETWRLQQAHEFLQQAINDYAGERDRRVVSRAGDPAAEEIFDAIEQWADRPELPPLEAIGTPLARLPGR